MLKHFKKLKYHFILLLFSLSFFNLNCKNNEKPTVVPFDPGEASTFTNPVINGADPSVYQKGDNYYYLQTIGNSIKLWKTNAMSKINTITPVTVFTPTSGAANSRNIWAPEIYFLDGKWYIYYTAGNGEDINQRTWVLENSSSDPTIGTWVEKGKIFSADANFWAIDGTVLEYNGLRYFLWCGRPDVTNVNLTQNIYIAKMSNPWTLEGSSTRLTTPEFAWEKNGFGVNEAPQIFKTTDNKIYMIYSASFCGTDDYSLGRISLKAGGNPLLLSDWTKGTQPVFTKKPQNNAFGPGHNSFFKSPDGTEDWIIYHANSNTNQGCADQRNVRIQKITFNADGSPNLGEPVPTGLKMNKPSGEK